jgi:hypothetical protein
MRKFVSGMKSASKTTEDPFLRCLTSAMRLIFPFQLVGVAHVATNLVAELT